MNAQVNTSNTAFDIVKWLIVVVLVVAAIGGNYYFASESLIFRVIGVVVALTLSVGLALTTVRGKAVNRLRKEAWVEVRKVVWPTRQETVQTTGIVLVFVALVSLILWLVDMSIGFLLSLIFG